MHAGMNGLGYTERVRGLGYIKNFNPVYELSEAEELAVQALRIEVPQLSNAMLLATQDAVFSSYTAQGYQTPVAIKSIFAGEIDRRKRAGTWSRGSPHPAETTDEPYILGEEDLIPDDDLGAGDDASDVFDTLPTGAKVGAGLIIGGAVVVALLALAK